ncbi:hypothetical protein, partial [Staphylococcus capitis]|uniref:hypothetical protein n=1 Tax=Staphylococcus capitis TaxID=29388 RepID=UPI003CFDBF0B
VEALVFQRMDVARMRAIETNLAADLAALTLPAGQIKTLGGSNAGQELTTIALDLLYTTDADRFGTVLAGKQLFADLANATDTTGRPLYPITGPSNANGSTAPGFSSMQVGGFTVVPVAGMTDGGYLIDQSAVVNWLGPVLEWTFDYEVAWVRLAHYQSQANAVVDPTGIYRLTYSAS